MKEMKTPTKTRTRERWRRNKNVMRKRPLITTVSLSRELMVSHQVFFGGTEYEYKYCSYLSICNEQELTLSTKLMCVLLNKNN